MQLIGRFENDGTGDNIAFPGSKIIARFNGADAVVKLSQTDGFDVGEHTWMNVVVDGVLQPKIEIVGASHSYTVAQGLAAGAHTVELEKRTEGNIAAKADPKISYFQFPEAMVEVDETGCQYHGNEAHHASMATLLTAEIKAKLGW